MHRFYKCRGRIQFGNCEMQAVAEEAIDIAFLEALKLLAIDISLEEPRSVISIDEIEKKLTDIHKRYERMDELYIDGEINRSTYQKRKDTLKMEELELRKLLSEQEKNISIEVVKEVVQNIIQEWHSFSFETRKQAVHTIFKSIEISLIQKAIPKKQKAIVKIDKYTLL